MTFFIVAVSILAYAFIASVVGKTAYKVNMKRCRRCKGTYGCSKEHDVAATFFGIFWFVTLIATLFLKSGDIVSDRIVNQETYREKKAARAKVKNDQKLALEKEKTEQLRLSADIMKSAGVNPDALKMLNLS